MKRSFVLVLALWSEGYAGVFPDTGYQPPAGWTGERFELSQNFPTTPQVEVGPPWKAIDFKTAPRDYLQALLDYCFDGNLQVDFVVQNNTVRKWYHAPWLHWGPGGRDFVKGLTSERRSRPFELSPLQTKPYRNFAVGFYNPVGGYTIGQVWKNPSAPAAAKAKFPEGTVAFKLLFTTAPAQEVPYLQNAPEWTSDIDRSPDPNVVAQSKVRLLQIDVAVRDDRALDAGWVFGTFQYDASVNASNPWKRLRPVTLMWGNDPTLTESQYNTGQRPKESWIDPQAPIVIYRSSPPPPSHPKTLGWAGRGNGPVDNPVSSCLSCHSTAQIPADSGMIPPASAPESEKLRWFRNLAPGEAFDAGSVTLDFSLQLGVGIHNQADFVKFAAAMGGVRVTSESGAPAPGLLPAKPSKPEYRFTRDPD